MKDIIAAGIVKHRRLILFLMICMTVGCGACIGRTKINYDLTKYLASDTMTRRALEVMQEEFGSSEQVRIMFGDTPEKTVEELAAAMNEREEVLTASFDPETDTAQRDGTTWRLVSLTLQDADATELIPKLRSQIEDVLSVGTYYVGGSAASQIDVQKSLAREIPSVMIISVAVILIVLLLTSHAWLEPLVILLVLAVSIVINMGTNFIFPQVSFITFAVCAILQLALSIDYAIMLLHTYHDCRDALHVKMNLKMKEMAKERESEKKNEKDTDKENDPINSDQKPIYLSNPQECVSVPVETGVDPAKEAANENTKGITKKSVKEEAEEPINKPAKETTAEAPAAMQEALRQCFMRIASSAMTTAAGLLSLLFMSFTIGFDIGLVLSKGIFISMITVFLLMPAITLLLERPLNATRHNPLRLGGEHLAMFIDRHRRLLAAVLILPVLCGVVLQSRNTYTFTDAGAAARTETSVIDDVFGISNPLVLLVPGGEEDADYDRQRSLTDALTEITLPDGSPAVGQIAAMVTTAAPALEYYTAGEVAEMAGLSPVVVQLFFTLHEYGDQVRADRLLVDAKELISGSDTAAEMLEGLETARTVFIGPHYARMIVNLNFMPSSKGFSDVMGQILQTTRDVYGEDFYVTGASMSSYDIGNAFQSDLLKVNLITFLAIFGIVTISFLSWRFALLLVFVIEGSIWITMGISYLAGQSIFFMSYLICLSIQMGATIDYGILLCDQYRSRRRGGLTPPEAMKEALGHALPTILTSGTILVTAGAIIGQRCSIYYISSIGSLLARGAFISVVLVLTLLPSLLLNFDKWVIRIPSR